MTKKLLITEKPSVAREFAKVLGINGAVLSNINIMWLCQAPLPCGSQTIIYSTLPYLYLNFLIFF